MKKYFEECGREVETKIITKMETTITEVQTSEQKNPGLKLMVSGITLKQMGNY